MNKTQKLTPSNIHYLLEMYALEDGDKGVRCVDIAKALGRSKPSVHNMMDTLMEMGLVQKGAYGNAFFTDMGRALAERYTSDFETFSERLSKCFPELSDVRAVTYQLLSEMPQDKLNTASERVR